MTKLNIIIFIIVSQLILTQNINAQKMYDFSIDFRGEWQTKSELITQIRQYSAGYTLSQQVLYPENLVYFNPNRDEAFLILSNSNGQYELTNGAIKILDEDYEILKIINAVQGLFDSGASSIGGTNVIKKEEWDELVSNAKNLLVRKFLKPT